MGGVTDIVEACSGGSATSATGLMGGCVARGSKRVPHLRGLTVVAVDMMGEMAQVKLMIEYIYFLFGVVEEDDDDAGGDRRGREQVTVSPEGLLYQRFASGIT